MLRDGPAALQDVPGIDARGLDVLVAEPVLDVLPFGAGLAQRDRDGVLGVVRPDALRPAGGVEILRVVAAVEVAPGVGAASKAAKAATMSSVSTTGIAWPPFAGRTSQTPRSRSRSSGVARFSCAGRWPVAVSTMKRARVLGSVIVAANTLAPWRRGTNFGSASGSRSFGTSSQGVGARLPSRKWYRPAQRPDPVIAGLGGVRVASRVPLRAVGPPRGSVSQRCRASITISRVIWWRGTWPKAASQALISQQSAA